MMKYFLFTTLALATSLSAFSGPFIIGGKTDDLNNDNGVFQVLIRDTSETGACTATKISKNFFITAAHCFHGKKVTALGFSSLTKNQKLQFTPLEFEHIIIHPDFEKLSLAEMEQMHSTFTAPDIALVKIKSNPDFEKFKSIELDFNPVSFGHNVEIWGYGCQVTIHHIEDYIPERKVGTSYTLEKDELKKGHKLMSEYYGYFADSAYKLNIATAGKKMDASASSLCFGDSGGPLLMNGKLVGINSNYTFNDMDPNDEKGYGEGVSYINLHARISFVADWIQTILKQ